LVPNADVLYVLRCQAGKDFFRDFVVAEEATGAISEAAADVSFGRGAESRNPECDETASGHS
jgi:hypothetical protein